ncbi:hypothetical protein [Frigidibacter sp.]|uniref:hypothetical protein n=1 Tax=Frigidibacter sp. TaxID=2586418 RepID=UPI00273632B5|nr:hypothetical protein [Frigidibacter sp.]MDP3340265.1 hypothetical protein [Frigidibacter sp.]
MTEQSPAPLIPDHGPAPKRGLSRTDFDCLGRAGLGDGHNNYAHSMAWFGGKLYLGTTRSNMCMLKFQSAFTEVPLEVWPVDCPDTRDQLYQLDFQAQIWCWDPASSGWEMVFRAPMVPDANGNPVPREIGYRSMELYQGPRDAEPALYIATWAPGRAPGGLILRTTDGRSFEPVTEYGIIDPPISTTRSLTSFRGRLHFAPTARRGTDGGQQNTAGLPFVFASDDPASGNWTAANEHGFGEPGNLGIFSLAVANDRLYAGTLNLEGLQVWVTDGDTPPPYRWRKVIDKGAGRGPLNQAVASMTEFKGALYVGTGIQGGGNDRVNKIGPAAAEVLRVNADDSWDVIVGDLDDDGREPLSGLKAGFGHFFNGYMWSMTAHDGWLYCGTYDWSVTLRWARFDAAPERVRKLLALLGAEKIIAAEGGADLWRSADGENWLPVCRKGFGNAYNWGIRNLVSTPAGLFMGTANVFGPRVAVRDGQGGWTYEDNPDGGLEVWLGRSAGGEA